MPTPALKCISMIRENTQTPSLGGWGEVETVDGVGKVTQEKMTDAEAAKVKAKKRKKNVK